MCNLYQKKNATYANQNCDIFCFIFISHFFDDSVVGVMAIIVIGESLFPTLLMLLLSIYNEAIFTIVLLNTIVISIYMYSIDHKGHV